MYTNSSLVTYQNTNHSHYSNTRVNITRVTVHCWVGQVTAQQGCDYFANTTRQVSSNYIVGKDGSIGLCVPEQYRSWCTSSSYNDNRAITIECASDASSPYAFTQACYDSLVRLVADICVRNNITLTFISDAVADRDRQTLTMHCQYDNTACPGAWFKAQAPQFCRDVADYIANNYNGGIGTYSPGTDPAQDTTDVNNPVEALPVILKKKDELYRVRKSVDDTKSQIGAYRVYENAAKAADTNYGYKVYKNGELIYTPKTYYTEYTVKHGDTLWGISAKFLGSGFKYKKIKELSGLKSNTLYSGQKLKIPKYS